MTTIAIDYTPALEQGGGIGRYVRELVRALALQDSQTDYRLFAAGIIDRPTPPADNFTWAAAPLSSKWLARVWHRARVPLAVEAFTGPIDIFHATDFTLPPVRSGTRTLLTVHDLSFIRRPETADPGLRDYLNQVVPRSVKQADHILADSEATRQDVIDVYSIPPDMITVLYCGVEDSFYNVADEQAIQTVRNKYDIGQRPFILSVGTVQPRKNYARLVQAMQRLNRPGVKLIIVGGKGWLNDPLYATIEELGMERQVQFLGYIPDDELAALYSAARVFAFPSLYEGFGIPPLEAMACGVPVVTSNVSSLPEVVGDAGIMVDPYDVDALAAALAQLMDDDDLRRSLIYKGQMHVQGFSWQTAAQQLRQIYLELL